MAPISQYTNSDAVRAAIGVDDEDVDDNVFKDRSMDVELLVDLDTWVATHSTIWTAGDPASSPSATEITERRYLQMYAMWFCATKLAALRLSMPQMVGDGKSEMRRFQEINWEAVMENAQAEAANYKRLLEDELGVAAGAVTVMSKASPGYDPVVGDSGN